MPHKIGTYVRVSTEEQAQVVEGYNRRKPNAKDPKVMRPGTIPYGFAYLEGKLVKDPKEYKTVLQIQKLRRYGKSCSAIAAILNNQKTHTRMGKRWGKSVIARILKRHDGCDRVNNLAT